MNRPKITCLVGSTRFRREYEAAFRAEEHAGRICLTVPCFKDDPCCKTDAERAALDALHLAKIDLADEVLVINARRGHCTGCGKWYDYPGNGTCACGAFVRSEPYVGESTRREISYALDRGKPVRYLEQP